MCPTQQFHITLPTGLAEAVRSKVASGDYASESEVICDGLRALISQDRAVDNWLFEHVAASMDKTTVEPSRLLTPDQVRSELAAKRQHLAIGGLAVTASGV